MTVTAHRLGPGTLKFGETGTLMEFSAQITNGRISPSLEEEDTITVLNGEELDGDDTISWVVAGTLLQSYDKAGIIHWAFTNRLAKLPFEFVPNTEFSDYGWRGTAKIVPLEAGGDVKTRNTSDFEFKIIGEPETYDIPL
jgi:hypothetical protein